MAGYITLKQMPVEDDVANYSTRYVTASVRQIEFAVKAVSPATWATIFDRIQGNHHVFHTNQKQFMRLISAIQNQGWFPGM